MNNQTLLFLIIIIATLMLTNFPTHADDLKLASDLIIINATVHTMDSNRPTAEAVAVKGNRIIAVGSSKEIRKMAGPNTRVIDAGKKVVLPGFNDAHVHFLGGGFQLSSVDLRDADTPQDLRANTINRSLYTR